MPAVPPDPAPCARGGTKCGGCSKGVYPKLGAVLQQYDDNGKLRPVAFESRKLNPAEQRYATHERETLAVIHALGQWRCNLLGKKVQVYTDHLSLKYLMTQPHLSSRQARWVEFLADYDLDIRYKAGKEMLLPMPCLADPTMQPLAAYQLQQLHQA